MMSFITTKFHEILLSDFSGVVHANCIFNFGQISKFKKGVTPRKKIESKFPVDCASTLYVLRNYKVSRNSGKWFQRTCADKLFSVVSFILVKFLSSKRV